MAYTCNFLSWIDLRSFKAETLFATNQSSPFVPCVFEHSLFSCRCGIQMFMGFSQDMCLISFRKMCVVLGKLMVSSHTVKNVCNPRASQITLSWCHLPCLYEIANLDFSLTGIFFSTKLKHLQEQSSTNKEFRWEKTLMFSNFEQLWHPQGSRWHRHVCWLTGNVVIE